MVNWVVLIWPATPSLPLPPSPTGHLTEAPLPTLFAHSGETPERKSVKMLVVPLPSERWTTMIGVAGRATPGLSSAILGSFHLVILPRKMSATSSDLSFSPFATPGRLYVTTTAPM